MSDPPSVPEPRRAIRGATEEQLQRPAGQLLGAMRWDGVPESPETQPAAAFLSRL